MFGTGVEPLAKLVGILTTTASLVSTGGSFYPWLAIGLGFISAVAVAVAPIKAVFGAVVHYFVPFLSFAVLLHDSFLGSSLAVEVGASSLCGTSGNRLFKVTNLPLQCYLFFVRSVAFLHEESE